MMRDVTMWYEGPGEVARTQDLCKGLPLVERHSSREASPHAQIQ